jgi:hypothetical protein|tara:strand:+ start:2420 stop:2668 length:249 start_codon:yes stop_codon:yes gene_type:complete
MSSLDNQKRRENFIKYANIRLANALKCIARLEPFSNRRFYEYSKEEKNKIINELEKAVRTLKLKLNEKQKQKLNSPRKIFFK